MLSAAKATAVAAIFFSVFFAFSLFLSIAVYATLLKNRLFPKKVLLFAASFLPLALTLCGFLLRYLGILSTAADALLVLPFSLLNLFAYARTLIRPLDLYGKGEEKDSRFEAVRRIRFIGRKEEKPLRSKEASLAYLLLRWLFCQSLPWQG